MIIWSGLGFLVAVIVFGASLIMELTTETLFRDDQYYQTHAWPLALALALSGAIVWALGNYLHASGARRHTLFFIPMRYWGPLLVALSILPFVIH
jgi:hypothetical protein